MRLQCRVRPLGADDRDWAGELLAREWGGSPIVSRGRAHEPADLPAFVAELEGRPAGLVTYAVEGQDCEVVTLNSLRPGLGAGQALLDAVAEAAAGAGCRRLWLVTTNDNTPALRFYQRRGWDLVAVHRDALAGARRLKPSIPEVGLDGIPIRHELELELRLR